MVFVDHDCAEPVHEGGGQCVTDALTVSLLYTQYSMVYSMVYICISISMVYY